MRIPQKAIDAAAKAIWDATGHNSGDWVYMAPETERPQRYKAYATAALAAAVPYLIRDARAAELEAAAEAIPDSVYTATVNAILRARAAAIRAIDQTDAEADPPMHSAFWDDHFEDVRESIACLRLFLHERKEAE